MEGIGAISSEKEGAITLVHFNTNMLTDTGYSQQAFNELKSLAESAGGAILVSLANVKYISSVGISLLVALNKHLHTRRIPWLICDVQPFVWGIMVSTGLDQAVTVHRTKEAALAALGQK